jgi:hypothetical protein
MDPDRIAEERRLFEELNARRSEYKVMEEIHDKAFRNAHAEEHGTPGFLAHLKQANEAGEQALAALGQYQSAVKALADFYLRNSKSKPE